MLHDPKKAKALAPQGAIDPMIYSIYQGFMRIPRPDNDLFYAPNLDHPISTVITPYRIYTLRTEEGGEKIQFATMVEVFRKILSDFNTSEEKHWIPLISAQERNLHIQFRRALEEEDEYCKQFLQNIDDSLVHFTVLKEDLCKGGDFSKIEEFTEDIKGRQDVTWRGKNTA